MSKETYSEIRLTLLNGDQITVQYPDSIAEEIWEDIREADDWWHVENWCDCVIRYKGCSLAFINMRLVAGIS